MCVEQSLTKSVEYFLSYTTLERSWSLDSRGVGIAVCAKLIFIILNVEIFILVDFDM